MFNFTKRPEPKTEPKIETDEEFTPEAEVKDLQAATELVRLGFNTPDDKMSQMTRLSARMAHLLSFSETMDYAALPGRKAGTLSKYWRESYYKHQRAVAGETFDKLVQLAHTQLGIAKDESGTGDMTKW